MYKTIIKFADNLKTQFEQFLRNSHDINAWQYNQLRNALHDGYVEATVSGLSYGNGYSSLENKGFIRREKGASRGYVRFILTHPEIVAEIDEEWESLLLVNLNAFGLSIDEIKTLDSLMKKAILD